MQMAAMCQHNMEAIQSLQAEKLEIEDQLNKRITQLEKEKEDAEGKV